MEIIDEGEGNQRVACGDADRQRCVYAHACWKTKCMVHDELSGIDQCKDGVVR
jgi:hypothetical protein